MAEAVGAKKKTGIFSRIAKFFKEMKSEMKKVVWPSRKHVVNNTLIVLATVLVIGIVIWVLDLIFQWGLFRFLAN